MKVWRFLFLALASIVAVFAASYFLQGHPGDKGAGVLDKTAWQRMASPGALHKAHAFLEHNCAACHSSVKGPESANCIACHANNQALLKREPTAFHAQIASCRECHLEHRGAETGPVLMDHVAFSKVVLRQLESYSPADGEGKRMHDQIAGWISQDTGGARSRFENASLTPGEAALDCAACHTGKDRHFKLFGKDCAQCHGTSQWTLPEFRHPSPTSTDCVQCHQAPPSHYMMHFQMISMAVAKKPGATVNQCFLCHLTTAWNDIRGVGWYKHH